MTEPNYAIEQRLGSLEKYAITHGESISKHNNELSEIKTERAVQKERDKNLTETLDRLQESINKLDATNNAKFNGIYKLGWWVLAAFGGSFVALIANFAFRGGFVV